MFIGTQPGPPSTIAHISVASAHAPVSSHGSTHTVWQRPLAHSVAAAHASPTFFGIIVIADGTHSPLTQSPDSGQGVVASKGAVHCICVRIGWQYAFAHSPDRVHGEPSVSRHSPFLHNRPAAHEPFGHMGGLFTSARNRPRVTVVRLAASSIASAVRKNDSPLATVTLAV